MNDDFNEFHFEIVYRSTYVQCRIKVGAIDAAALGPLLKIGPPS